MADKSIKYPLGMLENVPTKVGKFIIPTDFVVMDMEEDPEIPTLLGRPFLVTARVVIHMKNGKIKMEVNDESIVFDVFKMIKEASPMEIYKRVDLLDPINKCVNDMLQECLGQEPLGISLSQGADEERANIEVVAYVRMLESTLYAFPHKNQKV